MKPLLVSCLTALALGAVTARAQNPDPLVYTIGKTFVTDGGAARHNFLLWQPGDVSATYGKRFGIYAKDGDAASPNPYQRLGIQTLQTSPSAIQALLALGAKFDADASGVPPRVTSMFHEAKSTLDQIPDPLPTQIDLELAQKLGQLLQVAKDDPKILERVFTLGRAHPGVLMALGHGFAIQTAAAAVTTYEVREVDAANNDVQVIGRVTLDAANPQHLVAPGRPHPVPHPVEPELQVNASAKDHLSVRLRWATPDALRALYPHTFGFNLYRVKEATAAGLGWDLAPPPVDQLLSLVDAEKNQPDPVARRVNMLPINGALPMTEAQAANVTPPAGDNTTFFFGDDKNPPDHPFVDGETVYYFVAARDIAGHPGPLSPGTRVILCDRLPPSQPAIESIQNDYTAPATAGETAAFKGRQHLVVRIRQVPENPPRNAAKRYYVYRWNSARDWMEFGGNPTFNLIGSIAHAPGQRYVDFHDNNAADLDLDGTGPDTGAAVANDSSHPLMGKTVWYTVRAEDDTACAPKNLSGHSAPAYGVLRDRVGPAKPGGTIQRCVSNPFTFYLEQAGEVPKAAYGLPDTFEGFVVRFTRESDLIKSFDVQVFRDGTAQGGTVVSFSTTRHFSGGGKERDVVVPVAPAEGLLLRVRCRTGTGRVSDWRVVQLSGKAEGGRSMQLQPFRGTVRRDCSEVRVPDGATPPPHEVLDENGGIVGVVGGIALPADTREWRVYRRVGPDGDFELIARGAGSSLPPVEAWQDEAPTIVNGTTVCYYGQVFDEHSNSSPFTRLGCVTIKNGALPTPLLSDPEPLPPSGDQPLVRLKWFCDPVGVERFELWAAVAGGDDPGLGGPNLSPKLATSTNTVLNDETGEDLVFSLYQTATVGSSFGSNGAEFSIDTVMPPDKKVWFAVRAVGAGAFEDPDPDKVRAAGDFSNVVSDLWQAPPPPNQAVIPWPARDLASVQSLGMKIADYAKGEGPFFAQAMPAGFGCSAAVLVGAFPAVSGNKDLAYEGHFPADRDPLEWLFKFRRQTVQPSPANNLNPIAPFALYRHQVSNSAFPHAVPNLVQVTPLIDRIAYKFHPSGVVPARNVVRDPFFFFRGYQESVFPGPVNLPLGGVLQRDPGKLVLGIPPQDTAQQPPYLRGCNATMWLKDPVAATRGATYQYLLVRFTERGEIDRVIPTNTVTHAP